MNAFFSIISPLLDAVVLVSLLGMVSISCGRKPLNEGDPYAVQRDKMMRHQFAGLDRESITSRKVLEAMETVPRHLFVPQKVRSRAYADGPLPIGHDQTISQPYIVAFMTEKLNPRETDRVLEIGTGSGYQAAVLAQLVKEVFTIEIVEPLGKRAADTLRELGDTNVHVRIGDGYQGWPDQAPFDAIIVTCAPDHIPQPLIDQLKEGGRMMIPVGDQERVQQLFLLEKREGELQQTSVLSVRFVPMTGAAES